MVLRFVPPSLVLAVSIVSLPAQTPGKPGTDRHGDPLPESAIARLGTVRWRHGGSGSTLAFSPDGKLLAAAASQGVVQLFDPATGRPMQRIATRERTIYGLAFSADGSYLAVAGRLGRVCIHDTASGKEIRAVPVSPDPVYTIAFSPDGKHLAWAGFEGMVILADPLTGKELRKMEGHEGGIEGISFSPDSKVLASAGRDGTVRVWDLAAGREISRIRRDATEFHSAVFSPDGKALAVAATRLDAQDGDLVERWTTTSLVERLQQRPDPKRLGQLIANLDSKQFSVRDQATRDLARWGDLAEPALKAALADRPPLEVVRRIEDLLSRIREGPPPPGEPVALIETGNEMLSVLSFTPDGSTLALVSGDCIRLWNTSQGRELLPLVMPGRSIAALAFAPDSRTLAFTTASGVIVLARSEVDGRAQRWQPATFADAQRHGHIAPVKGIAWAADSKVLASCSPDGTVRLWDRGTARQIRILQNTDLNDAIAFSADGKFLSAIGFLDRNSRVAIRVWDTRDYRELRLIRSTQGTWLLGGLALSPDGKLAGASRRADPSPDGFVHRWDIASGKEQGEPVACTLIRSAPALFPDGKSIAVGDDARVIRIVDTGTGRVLHRLEGHSEAIWKVILSPDSRFLASFSEASRQSDGDIRLWDTSTGKEVQRLRFSAQQNVSVAFAADSSLLAAGWNDGSIRVWETASWRTVHRFVSPAGVECLSFSPDGNWLASGGSDTAILIWPIDAPAKRR